MLNKDLIRSAAIFIVVIITCSFTIGSFGMAANLYKDPSIQIEKWLFEISNGIAAALACTIDSMYGTHKMDIEYKDHQYQEIAKRLKTVLQENEDLRIRLHTPGTPTREQDTELTRPRPVVRMYLSPLDFPNVGEAGVYYVTTLYGARRIYRWDTERRAYTLIYRISEEDLIALNTDAANFEASIRLSNAAAMQREGDNLLRNAELQAETLRPALTIYDVKIKPQIDPVRRKEENKSLINKIFRRNKT